jgi:hypothetical protein
MVVESAPRPPGLTLWRERPINVGLLPPEFIQLIEVGQPIFDELPAGFRRGIGGRFVRDTEEEPKPPSEAAVADPVH